MCGRFTLTSSQERIAATLPDLHFPDQLVPRYNIAPSQPIDAVLDDNRTELCRVRWGLIPGWAKDASVGNRMINARAETVHVKPAFKRLLRQRRCVIPADGFYEWRKTSGSRGKVPMYIRLASREVFLFAGLWDRWIDGEGNDVLSATIITCSPNSLISDIHDRMPVILSPGACATWLNRQEESVELLLSCLKSYPAVEMEAYAVSSRVNSPGNDDAACIEPQVDLFGHQG